MDYKTPKYLLFLPVLILWATAASSQTYYSRTAQPNPKAWDDADSWTTSPDGSGPAAADYPKQTDHVVILNGHEILVNAIDDNDGPAMSADDLSMANVGSFSSSNVDNFYHIGDITVEEGGAITSTVRMMVHGTTFIAGDFLMGSDIINLGDMYFTPTASFSSGDDLICTGFSNTRIDIPSSSNSWSNDDVYIDHTDAWLCGLGILELGNGGPDPIINLNNGADYDQICDALTIIGCDPGPPCGGTGTYNPTPPVLTGTPGSLTYLENSVVAIDPGIGLTYGEPFLTTATISIIGGTYINGEDILALPSTSGINTDYNTTSGILTLTGYGGDSFWQSVLQDVTYENLSDNPTVSDRTVEFEISDGFATSNSITRTIQIQAENDPPDVSTISGSPDPLAYTEGDMDVPVDDEITLADPDDVNLEGAVIQVSSNYVNGEDVLDFANGFGVTKVGFNTTTGELTLTGTASLANYQSALRTVTYENTNTENPNTATRTVSFVVNDGDADSPPFDRDIEITAENDVPTLSGTLTALSYTEEDGAVAVDDAIVPDDVDDVNLEGAVIQISANYVNGEDVLDFADGFGVTKVGFNTTTGELTLTGTASLTNYQSALRTVTYENTNTEDPNITTRTVSFVVNDGDADSPPFDRDIEITAENDVPTLSGTLTALSYTEEDGAVAVDDAIMPDDVDDVNLEGAVIQISANYVNGEDVLDFADGFGVTKVGFNTTTGELTLTGTASLANYQSALRTVTYENTNTEDPNITTRTVSFVVNDGDADSPPFDRDIEITAENDVPTLSGTLTALSYTEEDGAVAVDDAIVPDDVDDVNLEGAVIQISANYVNGEDVLDFADGFGVTKVGFNTTTGELTLTGTASLANYQSALRTVTYENTNTEDPNMATRTVSFVVNDGDADSPPFDRDIEITAENDVPTLSGTLTALSYTEEDGAVAVDDAIVPDDVDDVNLEGAVIQISANYVNGEDVLDFADGFGVTKVGFNTTTGELTLTGTASLANYQSALRTVTYENTNVDDPNTTTRTVSFVVSDGDADSPPFDRDIEITAINDPPMITSTAGITATEDVPYTYTATVSDPDDPNDGVEITWTLSNEPAGMVVSSTGEVTWTPGEGVTTSGLVTLSVEDGDEDGSPPDTEDFTITVNPVNDPPVITSTAGVTATEDVPYTYTATVSDPDDPNDGVEITWTLSNEPAGMVVSSAGEVTWTPGEGVTTSGLVTLSVEDGDEDGSPPDTEDFTITVNPVNDPPMITSTAGVTATEDVPYTYTATVSDPDDPNDGVEITWTLSNEPAGMVVSSTGEVTWTPGSGITTSGLVTLSVEDGDEDGSPPDFEDFTINVLPFNDPPSLTSTAPTTATEDIQYIYMATVDDPDDANNGVDLTWTLSNEPAGMTVNTTGEVTWTPGEGILTSGAVTLTVQDGGENGATPDSEIFTISVTPVNDKPTVTASISSLIYQDGDGMIPIDQGITTDDPDDSDLESATITIASNYVMGEDNLSFTPLAGISGTFDDVTGILSLSGTATLADYQSVLQLVSYSNGSTNPDESTRTVNFLVNDGELDSDIASVDINVVAVNTRPIISGGSGPLDYTEGSGSVVVDNSITLSDPDDINLESASITFSANYLEGEDILAFSNQSGISGSFSATTGVLSLTGTSSLGNFETALRSIAYENTSNNPDVSTRTLDFIVNDGDDNSTVYSLDVLITSVPEPPALLISEGALNYIENDGATIIDDAFTVSDTDDINLEGATITLSNYVDGEDILSFSDQNGINGSFDTSTGTLTLSGTALVIDYQTAVRSITYENTSDDPSTLTRTINVILNDGDVDSNPSSREIIVTAVNDPPLISGSTSDLGYTEGSGPMVIDDQVVVTDLDDTFMEAATISMGSTFVAGEDVLTFSDQLGITGILNPTSGDLELTGSASIDDYMLAIGSITYENLSTEPDLTTRTVSFIVNDGDDNSTSFERNILISGVNEPPDFVDGSGAIIDTVRFTIQEDEVGSLCVNANDPESNNVNLESVSSTSADGTFDNGQTGDLCFTFTPSLNFNGVVYGSLTICDDGSPVSCSNAVVEITVLPVNDPPVANDDEYTVNEDEVVMRNVLDNDSDPDGDILSVDIVPIIGPSSGVLMLNSDGSFTFTPEKDFFGQVFFTYRVCDNGDPSGCDNGNVTITFIDVEDPVIAYQVLTPNDDAFNDSWVIDGIEQFPNNTVQIFDRWSSLVYRIEGYNNNDRVWNGEKNEGITDGELPNGTYFYVIDLGNGNNKLEGFVELRR